MSTWGNKKRKGGGGQTWKEKREKKKEQRGSSWSATDDTRKGYEGPHPGSYAAAELAALDDAAEETAATSGAKRKVAVLLVRCSMRSTPLFMNSQRQYLILAVHIQSSSFWFVFVT